MDISVFDCKPFREGMHTGKEKGEVETVVNVAMGVFRVDVTGMKEEWVGVYQAYGRFNNMFVTQARIKDDTRFVIGDFNSTYNYLIELGVYKDKPNLHERLHREMLKYFSIDTSKLEEEEVAEVN